MQLYVEKDTDLMRSTFVAVGLATLFEKLPRPYAKNIRIIDMGSAYAIDIPYEREDALNFAREYGHLPAILPVIHKPLSQGELKEVEKGTSIEEMRLYYEPRNARKHGQVPIDYGAEKQKLVDNKPQKGERQEGDVAKRPRDYPVWAHLCSYFGKGSAMRKTYPSILHAWHAHEGDNAVRLLEVIMGVYGESNAVEEGEIFWKKEILPLLNYPDFQLETRVTASALVAPSTVQGISMTTGAGSLNNNPLDNFWLDVYFAFAGYLKVGLPYNVGDDVLLYYPLPHDIRLSRLVGEVEKHRDDAHARNLYQFSGYMMRPKLDALAHISFYRSVVEHTRNNRPLPEEGEVGEWMSGLVGYFYKNVATQIPFDEVIFALPRWLPLNDLSDEQLGVAEQLLSDHYELINRIRGAKDLTGDELKVLGAYREFITLGTPQAWVKFVNEYHFYYFSKIEDMRYLSLLTLSIVEDTLMNMQSDTTDYRPILTNEGFRNIAKVIRDCTVQAQYRSGKDKSYPFNVRYGLGDDLLRKAHSPAEFLGELNKFLHDYARESSNVQADTGQSRSFYTDSDLLALVELISQYGSQVVASLLVATGYASSYDRKSAEQA
jgi:hypothetical protein